MKVKQTIKDIPIVDRPREKLVKYGVEKLSNAELLAIILKTGSKKENVLNLSKRLLREIGLENLENINLKKLTSFNGIGFVKAGEIISFIELSKRILLKKQATLYISPKDVFQELREIRFKKKEYFVVFYLDIRRQEIKKEIISIGTLNELVIHPREIFEAAIRNVASQIIIAHNHPLGECNPTDIDIKITKRLVKAGQILGINIIDHVIVTKNNFFSMKDAGLL